MNSTHEFAVVVVDSASDALAQAAADAIEKFDRVVKERGVCLAVFVNSSALFEALVAKDADLSNVIGFQIDGVGSDHILESVKLAKFKEFHFASEGVQELNALVAKHPIDLCFVSLGSNGQLGINDPPNLECSDPFLTTKLSETSRADLVSEGVLKEGDDVSGEMVTMSLQQIMKSRQVIALAVGKRKAAAVKNVTEGTPSAKNSASFLQKHQDCVAYIDSEAASLLKSELAKNGPSNAPASAPSGAAPNKGFMIRT
jgi:glucosamine-6-phosphate deaminase